MLFNALEKKRLAHQIKQTTLRQFQCVRERRTDRAGQSCTEETNGLCGTSEEKGQVGQQGSSDLDGLASLEINVFSASLFEQRNKP